MANYKTDEPQDGTRPLKNPRWEAYAHEIGVNLKGKAEAYRYAYPDGKPSNAGTNANKIEKMHPEIVARVHYLRNEQTGVTQSRADINKQWIEDKMLALYKKADAVGDRQIAFKALHAMGVELGMFVQRKDVNVRRTQITMLGSPEQVLSRILLLAQKAFPGTDTARLRELLAERVGVQMPAPRQIPETVDAEIVQ